MVYAYMAQNYCSATCLIRSLMGHFLTLFKQVTALGRLLCPQLIHLGTIKLGSAILSKIIFRYIFNTLPWY